MISWLSDGKWERPSDTMAVYTEIPSGKEWGIRVTLIKDFARVEVINGPKCTWYKPGAELSMDVMPPNLIERFRGVTFESKLKREVAIKREAAARRESRS